MKKNAAAKSASTFNADEMITTNRWAGKLTYSYLSEALGHRVVCEVSMPFIWADTKKAAESALLKGLGKDHRAEMLSVRLVEENARCCAGVRTTL